MPTSYRNSYVFALGPRGRRSVLHRFRKQFEFGVTDFSHKQKMYAGKWVSVIRILYLNLCSSDFSLDSSHVVAKCSAQNNAGVAFPQFRGISQGKNNGFSSCGGCGRRGQKSKSKTFTGHHHQRLGEIRPEIERPSLAVESNNRERRFVSSSAMQASIGVEMRRRVSFCQSQEERNAGKSLLLILVSMSGCCDIGENGWIPGYRS